MQVHERLMQGKEQGREINAKQSVEHRNTPKADYHPDPQINAISDWLGSPVEAANFPQVNLRFRNDRAAQSVGLNSLSDAQWVKHFGRFAPLEGNLHCPLALKYHGHQFRHYNPDIGDGRGFLYAQMRGDDGRLLDLGTKGSGPTPYSRGGDGRLTLKGAVREILASEMLEALGVNTSKTFSVIETGEALERGDEPSPTRSAVMLRLSHGHIRIGSFQRLAALEETENLRALTDYCLEHYPGPPPPENSPDADNPAVRLMHQVTERMADLAASWMVAGFVHGVLNTDNMNISGESFDYGPWRFLPQWDPAFTAAYFDTGGLYAFGRQPEAMYWNCGQLAMALRSIAEGKPLIAAVERFGDLYMRAIARRWCWRLGVEERGFEQDSALVNQCDAALRESGEPVEVFFHQLQGGRDDNKVLGDIFKEYHPLQSRKNYKPQSLLLQEVEDIWAAIDERDDWQPLMQKLSAIREMGRNLGLYTDS